MLATEGKFAVQRITVEHQLSINGNDLFVE